MAKTPTEIRALAPSQTVATVAQLRAHIERVRKANGIGINYGRHASASYYLREIWIRAIRSPLAYATALHEIGHILGRYQMKFSVMVREPWAWQWARRNALQWTPAMEQATHRRGVTGTVCSSEADYLNQDGDPDHIRRRTVALPPASNSYSSPHFQMSGKYPSPAVPPQRFTGGSDTCREHL